MRPQALSAFILMASLLARPQNTSPMQAPHLKAGTITGSLYENEAVGVKMALTPGWSAEIPSVEGLPVDSQHPDSMLNRCSQRLLNLETRGKKGKDYPSSSILLAMNPDCFPSATLPTTSDPDAVRAFAGELVKIFHETVYLPPGGVDIGAEHKSKHQFIYLQGYGYRKIDPGNDGKKVHVNSLISATESRGYWIVWVSLVDDAAKKELIKSSIQFKED